MADLSTLYMRQYSDNLKMLSQQLVSRFADHTIEESATGSNAFRFESQMSQTAVVEHTTRATPAFNIDVTLDARWVHPKTFGWGTVVDDIDLIKTRIMPQGKFVQSAVAAIQRKRDELFLEAFFGDAASAVEGGSTTSFDSNNVVAVDHGGSAEGLTIGKIREASKILMANEVLVDMEKAYMGVTSTQFHELTAYAQVTNKDFNGGQAVITSAKLPDLFGMNIVQCELIPTDGSGYRRLPVWVKTGVGRATWKPMQASIRTRGDLVGEPFQVEALITQNFVRLEEAKCVEIKCAE